MEIGEKIKHYRKLNNLTQRELAEQSGISVPSITKYECNERFPKKETLKLLADVLGDEFFDTKQDSTCLALRTQTDDIIFIPPNTHFMTTWQENRFIKNQYTFELIFPFADNGYENLSNKYIIFDSDCINGHLLSLMKRIKYEYTDEDLLTLNRHVRRLMGEVVASDICEPEDNSIIDIESIYIEVLKSMEKWIINEIEKPQKLIDLLIQGYGG